MAINDGFVTAVSPKGQKRRVPAHYVDNKALGYKLPPKGRKAQQKPGLEPEPVSNPTPAPTPTIEKETS